MVSFHAIKLWFSGIPNLLRPNSKKICANRQLKGKSEKLKVSQRIVNHFILFTFPFELLLGVLGGSIIGRLTIGMKRQLHFKTGFAGL